MKNMRTCRHSHIKHEYRKSRTEIIISYNTGPYVEAHEEQLVPM